MTRRLYYDNSYCAEFNAQIQELVELEGRPAAILDETFFYPTSGGQPADRGMLNGVPVLDVLEADDRILHVLATRLAPGPARGIIDWSRRFDHMQQHTGQHILSQAFERELGAATVSFHLGEQSCTIDLALAELSAEDAARVEDLANRIIYENRPVTAREYAPDEIACLGLRKPPAEHERIRVVHIEGFDVCACGGTHVRTTGEVGSIHIRRWERRREQTRIEFLCGWRALRDYRIRDALCQGLAANFSVAVEELPQAVARLNEAEQKARRRLEATRKRLIESELPRLKSEAEQVGRWRVLCRLLEDYDASNMSYAARQIVQESSYVVCLAVTEPAVQICLARSQDVNLDVLGLFREIVMPYGGRGGGKANWAQGGGIPAEAIPSVLEHARERLGAHVVDENR